jgi:WD40 repeat protein
MSSFVAVPPSPYKGLAPFEDSDLDALLFFGRERESEVIAANLMAARMTVLYGPSGVGKSSVLRAGVAHRLRQEQEVDVVVFSTWTGDPVAGLVEAVGGRGDSLVDALADAADRAGGDLYLILDQFEEYFLYQPNRGPFASQLAEVGQRSGLRVNVLIGMREDALARLDALKALIPNLLTNRLRLERLDRAAGEAAIVGPIGRFNTLAGSDDQVEIEPELVAAVLNEVAAGRVDLGISGRGVVTGAADEGRVEAPYLQLVLARLWDVESERSSQTLRLATLRELGGAERIVEDHLERAMAALSPREKGAAAAMYNFLVTPSGTKIAHGVGDLAGYAAVDEGEASRVLQRLTSERIVRASSENGPTTTRYEIFHDVLADAVLAWRNRFEAEHQIAEERVQHERRQRRLLTIFGAALIAFLAMSAVAIYALAQRSNARHQADVAQVERTNAERQAGIAGLRRRQAERQEAVAKQKTREARQAQRTAQQKEQEASAARLEALAQKASAEGNRAKALEFAAAASRARNRAQAQTQFAKRQKNRAVRATALANQQRKVTRAKELAASARAVLSEDPEESVRRAIAAVEAFRSAGLKPGAAVEDALRDGLLVLRLKAVLPGGGRGPVRVVQFSPDGSRVLLAGKHGARLFDRAHGFRLRRLEPITDLTAATFSPDGRLVAAGGAGKDHAARVWDAQSGAVLYTLPHRGPVLSIAFSRNGQFIATGSADGTARLWSVAGGLPLAAPFEHPAGARSNFVQMVSFSPDSSRLLTVGGDRFARVYDVAKHELAMPPINNTVLANTAHFSHNGKLIATAGADMFVRIWDASSGAPHYAPLRGTGRVTDLAFNADDTLLATAGSNDTIARIWNIEERSSVGIISAHRSGVESVGFSPDGRAVVTAGRDGKANLARSEGGFNGAALIGHRGPLSDAIFSPDGETILTASDDGTARLWSGRVDASGSAPPTQPREIGRHTDEVTTVAFSPDGGLTLSAGKDGTALIRGAGGRVVTLRHAGAVNAGAFSRTGRTVITASQDGTARVWRASDGELISTFDHLAAIVAANLSPDGRIAVTAGRDGSAKLWNARRGNLLHALSHSASVNDARFSTNGTRIVTGSADQTAVVWRVSDGRKLATMSGHGDVVVAAAFSPDGRHVATASADSTARIWNSRSGEIEHELIGHTGAITSFAFSPDGRRLATASADTDARVWNVRSGAQVALLRGHVSPINDIAFSFDGRWIATAGPTSVGVWQARKVGTWPALPLFFVRGPTRPMSAVAFAPRGWRVLFGSRDGSVMTYDCKLCGGVKQLTAMGRGRLREILRVKS